MATIVLIVVFVLVGFILIARAENQPPTEQVIMRLLGAILLVAAGVSFAAVVR